MISHGLVFLKYREAIDIAVVDQLQGPTTPCNWLEFMRTDYQGEGEISVCWFYEGERPYEGIYLKNMNMKLHLPNGWNYEISLSKQFQFIPTVKGSSKYKLLRRENGVDVFLDLVTGEEVFSGRNHHI